jgi:transcription elongation GreA/GreB family factor
MIRNTGPESRPIENIVPEIKRSIEAGHAPMLPFERDLLLADITKHGAHQKELAGLISEAMDQTSETWHDNAPADAIFAQSHLLGKRAEQTLTELRSAAIFEYPKPGNRSILLGSIVEVNYPGETESEHVLLTGVSRIAPEVRADAPVPSEFEVVTVRSPLGEALLGREEGETAVYRIQQRKMAVGVLSIVQLSPEYLSGTS